MDKPENNRIKLSRIQSLIGHLMLDSKHRCPAFYMDKSVDLTDLLAMRKPYCKKVGVRVSTNDFFIRAIAQSISNFPIFAGVMDPSEDFIQISPQIGVGFAVAAPHGLVVPVIQNAGEKSLIEISMESNALLKKARANKLLPSDLERENVVLSGLGMYGVYQFFAIAPPNAAGIISIGNIHDVIIPIAEGFTSRKKMCVSLAANRRIVDEITAARFLNDIIEQLENPHSMTN